MTEEDKPIRVVDRRMFTPEGDLRPDYEADEREEPPKPVTPPPSPQPVDAADAAETAGKAEPEPGPPPAAGDSGFLEILRSLGTTAYSSLGLVPDPSGSRRRDPAVARQMIDWLAVLEQKTRGNLTFEESDLLARILYELRMAYVEVMRPPPGEPKR
ncbi:MAG TPA: DUF1844 domain-containing protein [Thermoanaerobaculia bacterium]